MNIKIPTIGTASVYLMIAFSCTNTQNVKEANKENLPNIVLLMGDDHGWDEVG